MPNYSSLVFDLDGTLSDPALGFVRCMNYALTSFDYSPLPDADLTQHIGPPLEATIQKLTGSDDVAHVDALAATYRERYAELGYLENEIYPGINEMLSELVVSDIRLGVCTSKLHPYALKVLEAFELVDFFDFVCGARGKVSKAEQLKQLTEEKTIDSQAIMIGDRSVDLTAAHSNGLHSAGVLWGYGDFAELSAENPLHLFENPADLTVSLGKT